MKQGIKPTHPLNIRRHYHILSNLVVIPNNNFSSKKLANLVALKKCKRICLKKGLSYKGGNFGQTGLAFYLIGGSYIEVIACEEYGPNHIPVKV